MRCSSLAWDSILREASYLSDLVKQFALALYNKLLAAESKYNYHGGWRNTRWENVLRWELRAHLRKGDPRDVAAYCAFAWYHGWSVEAPQWDRVPVPYMDRQLVEALRYLVEYVEHQPQGQYPFEVVRARRVLVEAERRDHAIEDLIQAVGVWTARNLNASDRLELRVRHAYNRLTESINLPDPSGARPTP